MGNHSCSSRITGFLMGSASDLRFAPDNFYGKLKNKKS
jgi:hypothetical protein